MKRRGPDRRKRQVRPCSCGHFRREHEHIWDPEAEPTPCYFWFCHGCFRAQKKYPDTHHTPNTRGEAPPEPQ